MPIDENPFGLLLENNKIKITSDAPMRQQRGRLLCKQTRNTSRLVKMMTSHFS